MKNKYELKYNSQKLSLQNIDIPDIVCMQYTFLWLNSKYKIFSHFVGWEVQHFQLIYIKIWLYSVGYFDVNLGRAVYKVWLNSDEIDQSDINHLFHLWAFYILNWSLKNILVRVCRKKQFLINKGHKHL